MRCFIRTCQVDLHDTLGDHGISIHRFPTDPGRSDRWMRAITTFSQAAGEKIPEHQKTARLCSCHFEESDYIRLPGKKRKLAKNAIPRIFLSNDARVEYKLVDGDGIAECSIKTEDLSDPLQSGQVGAPVRQIVLHLPPEPKSPTNKVKRIPATKTPPVTKPSKGTAKTKKKSLRYAGDIKDVDEVTPEEALRILPKIQRQLAKRLLRINLLKQQNLRLRKKVANFQKIEDVLKARGMMSARGEMCPGLLNGSFLNGSMCMKTGRFKATRSDDCDSKPVVEPSKTAEHGGIQDPNELRFNCVMCSQRFRTKRQLERHDYIHTGFKPHICDQCGKRFRFPDSLKGHLNWHSNTRPYVCEICGRGFMRSSYLREHRITHSEELSYECNHCDKKFKCHSSLSGHIRRVHKDGVISEEVVEVEFLDDVEILDDMNGEVHSTANVQVGKINWETL